MSKLLKHLRGGHEPVSQGRLSFDREEARAKMRMFRLPNPHFYVLQFVRAASVLGCGHVDFELTANRMVCSFAEPLATQRFDDFWGAVFDARETPQERALHNIALGIGSAQALSPKKIHLQSGDQEIVFTDDGETVQTSATSIVGTRIEMIEKFRLGQLLDFFTDHAEMKALRDHCRFAEILVTVDGLSIRATRGQFVETFTGLHESGFAGLKSREVFARGATDLQVLAGPQGQTTFHFLRDDVLVRSHTVDTLLVPAVGAVNSRLLQTDLSGLELASDETLDDLLYSKLYAAYHGSLLRWIEQMEPSVDMKEAGMQLFRHLERLHRMPIETPKATERFIDWWRREKIFEGAIGSQVGQISATDAQRDGVIAYSSRRFSDPLAGYEQVVFANTSADQLLMHQLRAGGLRTKDVTLELSRAADSARRRKIWEDQPQRTPTFFPVIRIVKSRRAVGELFLPVSAEGTLQPNETAFTTYARGRKLARRALKLPFGMLVDGPLEIDDMYRDVIRDKKFQDLSGKLVAQVPYFVRNVLRHALTDGSPDLFTTSVELLDGYMSGALFQLIADELRYPLTELVPRSQRIDNETSRPALLDRLGDIADLEIFRTANGAARSLRQVDAAAKPPVLLDPRVATEDVAMLHERGHDVFVGGQAQHRVLRQIRPDAEGRQFVEHVMNEVRFLGKPVLKLPKVEALGKSRNRWVMPEGSFTIDVELVGEGSTCESYFFYHKRLLATRSLPSMAGRFRAIVRSNDLTPKFDFSDVVEDALVKKIYACMTTLAGMALGNWCMQARVVESLDPGHFRLLWDASAAWAREKPRALTIPVWRWRGRWERDVVSLEELTEIAESDGGVLRAHRGQHAPPRDHTDHLVVRCPVDANVGLLVPARIIEVDSPVNDEARDMYMRRPVVVTLMLYAPFRWSGEIDGVQLTIGMFNRPGAEAFGHANDLQLLWEDRRLEQISQPVPFGTFRTLATSSSVVPDPNFEFAASGRNDVLRSAHLGIAQLIEELCRQLAAKRNAPRESIEQLLPDLLHMFAACRREEPPPPFDFLELLRDTPLYATTFGGRLSFNELHQVAIEGVIPYVTAPSFERALLIDFELLSVIEETLGSDYAVLPLSAIQKILGPSAQPTPTATVEPSVVTDSPPESDPLLAELVRLLGDASGAWLPDAVVNGLSFDEDISELAHAELDGVRLQRGHRLVEFCERDSSDSIPMRFLASVVGSTINRDLRVVTDVHELELQAALIRID